MYIRSKLNLHSISDQINDEKLVNALCGPTFNSNERLARPVRKLERRTVCSGVFIVGF